MTEKKSEAISGNRAGVSKNSTFEEAYSYLQSFRPTESEVAEWMDETNACFKSETGFQWEAMIEERGGGKYLHREAGKPAVILLYGKSVVGGSGGDWPVEMATFMERGLLRKGGKPWKIEFTRNGEVWHARFTGEEAGETADRVKDGLHRMDGPVTVALRRDKSAIELYYAVNGETVEKVTIRRGELVVK